MARVYAYDLGTVGGVLVLGMRSLASIPHTKRRRVESRWPLGFKFKFKFNFSTPISVNSSANIVSDSRRRASGPLRYSSRLWLMQSMKVKQGIVYPTLRRPNAFSHLRLEDENIASTQIGIPSTPRPPPRARAEFSHCATHRSLIPGLVSRSSPQAHTHYSEHIPLHPPADTDQDLRARAPPTACPPAQAAQAPLSAVDILRQQVRSGLLLCVGTDAGGILDEDEFHQDQNIAKVLARCDVRFWWNVARTATHAYMYTYTYRPWFCRSPFMQERDLRPLRPSRRVSGS
ncbi:hypothetical protein DENSPDRAFT_931148 [Dentipellis sp. KUC8613]|nr:hypothetical protein DENSPDRAFT_931148 [Dentipellis sp. KUC8613]